MNKDKNPKQMPSSILKQKKITDLYETKVSLYSTDDLEPNPWNANEMPRDEFESLKESIKTTKGKYLRENPIKARINGSLEKLEIVDGEHRWRACKELGIDKVPVEIIEIDTEKAMKLNVIFTMNRGHINYFKLSKLLNEYKKTYEATYQKIAEEFGINSESRVKNIIKIYPRLKNFYDESSHANFSNRMLEELASCKDDFLRGKLIDKTLENKWTSKTIRTQATKFNEISKYLDELTSNEQDKQGLLESIEDIIFDFDAVPIKNKIDGLFKELSQKKIILGDCFEVIPKLEQEAGCIMMDPPYNLSNERVYDLEGRKNMTTEFGEWDHHDENEFLEFLRSTISLLASKLKDGGAFVVFTSDHYISDLRRIFMEYGLKYRSAIYWHKTNPANSVQKNRDVSSVEVIAYATKGDSRTYNWLGQKKAHNFIETSICQGKERTTHPTQKPLEVMKWLIEKYTNPGDLILDPFAGSGSTGIACKEMGRNFILIEKEKKYYDLIDMRFKAMEEEI